MNRRLFLKRSSVAAAGLVVGDAALDAYERLTWRRRLFSGWSPEPRGRWCRLVGVNQYGHEIVVKAFASEIDSGLYRIPIPLQFTSGGFVVHSSDLAQ